MARVTFKKETNKIIINSLVYPLLEEAYKEIEKDFLEKFKINKNSYIEIRYSGGDYQDIIIHKQ